MGHRTLRADPPRVGLSDALHEMATTQQYGVVVSKHRMVVAVYPTGLDHIHIECKTCFFVLNLGSEPAPVDVAKAALEHQMHTALEQQTVDA